MRLLELGDIQATANRIRAAAGIEPEDVVPDIVSVLRALGLVVAMRELGSEALDGIYVPAGGPLLVLNTARSACRLRFTAAHVLAHHVYGDEPLVDRDVEAPTDDPVERRASRFATCFLISREAAWARRQQVGPVTVRDALDLARRFGVGYRVLVARLNDIGMVGEDVSETLLRAVGSR